MKALLLTLLLALSVSAQSIKEGKAVNDWLMVFSGGTENAAIISNVYWSPSSIQRDGDIIKLWIKADFPASGVDIVGSSDGKLIRGVVSAREFMVIDCKKRVAGGDTEIIYFKNGRTQSRENFFGKNSATDPSNEQSFGQFLSGYFCEREEVQPKTPPQLKPRLTSKNSLSHHAMDGLRDLVLSRLAHK
jgi:hypothetical protein